MTSPSLVVQALVLLGVTVIFVLSMETGLVTLQVQKFKHMATGFILPVVPTELLSAKTVLIVHILTATVISALQQIILMILATLLPAGATSTPTTLTSAMREPPTRWMEVGANGLFRRVKMICS